MQRTAPAPSETQWAVIRHVPLGARKGPCWLALATGTDPESIKALLAEQAADRSLTPGVLEVEALSRDSINLAEHTVAQTIFDPVFLVAAFKNPIYEATIRGVVTLGGQSLANRLIKQDRASELKIKKLRARVLVVQTPLRWLRSAVEDIESDENDGVVMQIISERDEETAREQAISWVDSLQEGLTEQLAKGAGWEQAVAGLRVNDRTAFSRKHLR